MSFADIFRVKYRETRRAAKAGDEAGTLKGLAELYQLFAAQYSLQNGDSIVTKAKLSYWQEVFGGYIGVIRKNGLRDRRVQKFFGLIEDDDIPSLGDILSGTDGEFLPFAGAPAHDGEIDVAGIIDMPGEGARSEEAGSVAPPAEETPVAPAEAVKPIHPEQGEGVATKPDLPKPSQDMGEDLPAMPAQNGEGEHATPAQNGEGEHNGEHASASFDPDSLETFIGQQHIVKPLLKEIAIAKAQGRRYLDNILLLGNPGLGKSTLMRLIAKALGVRFEWMDCSQYRNSQQSLKALQNFLMKVARENEPVVIAFDEIHMLTDELQSSLLTLLNSRVYVSPPDVNGNIKRIPIEEFTFIAATTDDDKVLNTIKDRCLRLKFQMVDYTPDELKRIYKVKIASGGPKDKRIEGLRMTDEAIDISIPRSRGSMRYVDAFIGGFMNELYDENGILVSKTIDRSVVERYFEEKGIDAIGLEKKDLEILRVLEENPSGAMGAETLSARVGLDPKKYLSEYEPYLIKIGFVNVSGRGRSLTEKAIKYLKESK